MATDEIVWSVVEWSCLWALQKWLNGLRYPLGVTRVGPRMYLFRWGLRYCYGKLQFWGIVCSIDKMISIGKDGILQV